MFLPPRPRQTPPEAAAELRLERTADGSLTLRDARVGQTYGSGHGALAEARHVFLHGSGAAARLAAGRATRVLEVGLGTGLNFLVTADAAVTAGAELDYRALESRLPPAELLERLEYQRGLSRPEICYAWIAGRRALGDAAPTRWTQPRGTLAPGVALEVVFGDATAADAAIAEPGWADGIYHDAFSPDAAPGLWSEEFLRRLTRCLAPGGVLVTYSVKGLVRRRLAALGLRVEKRPGPKHGKREMLHAMREAISPRERDRDPMA